MEACQLTLSRNVRANSVGYHGVGFGNKSMYLLEWCRRSSVRYQESMGDFSPKDVYIFLDSSGAPSPAVHNDMLREKKIG